MAGIDLRSSTSQSGASATALSALTDVTLATPADTQVLTYDAASGKWKNAAVPAGGGGVTATVNGTPASSLAITDATAADVPYTPTGLITETNVQTAVAGNSSRALQKASNLSDLASAATARTNLGLGTAATQASTAFDAAGAAAAVTTTTIGAIPTSQKGAASGVATLDTGGQVPLSQLGNAPGGGAGTLTVQDEGSALTTAATTINFVGTGVTATGTGATKTVTIPGATAPNTFVSGNRYAVAKGTIGTLAMSLNREYAVRWDGADTVLSYLGTETTTAVATASLRFAIRAADSAGKPGAVVTEAAADASAIGAVGITLASVTIHRGDWLIAQAQTAVPTIRSTNYSDPYVPRPDATATVGAGLFGVGNASGALPTTFTNSGVSASSPAFSITVA